MEDGLVVGAFFDLFFVSSVQGLINCHLRVKEKKCNLTRKYLEQRNTYEAPEPQKPRESKAEVTRGL